MRRSFTPYQLVLKMLSVNVHIKFCYRKWDNLKPSQSFAALIKHVCVCVGEGMLTCLGLHLLVTSMVISRSKHAQVEEDPGKIPKVRPSK